MKERRELLNLPKIPWTITTRWSAEEELEFWQLQTSRLPSTDSAKQTLFSSCFSMGSRSIEIESDQIQLMKKYRSKPLNFRNRTKKLMDKLTAEIGFGNSKKVCSGNEEGTRTMQTCQRRKRESKTRKCNVEVRNLLVGFVRVIPTSPELTLSTPLCFS